MFSCHITWNTCDNAWIGSAWRAVANCINGRLTFDSWHLGPANTWFNFTKCVVDKQSTSWLHRQHAGVFTFQYAKARVQQVNAHHCLRNNTVKQGMHAGLSLRETTETRCQKCSLSQSHWQRTLLHGDWNDTELEQFNASVNNAAR